MRKTLTSSLPADSRSPIPNMEKAYYMIKVHDPPDQTWRQGPWVVNVLDLENGVWRWLCSWRSWQQVGSWEVWSDNSGTVSGVITRENSFREIVGLFRMSPRGHVETLTPRTWERRRTSCRCVTRGKCRSMRMRVLETERTNSPNVNITDYIQIRGTSRSNSTFHRLV